MVDEFDWVYLADLFDKMRITTKQVTKKKTRMFRVSIVWNWWWLIDQNDVSSWLVLWEWIVEVVRRISLNYELFSLSSVSYRSRERSINDGKWMKMNNEPSRYEYSSFYRVFSRDFVFLLKKINRSVCLSLLLFDQLPFASSSVLLFFGVSFDLICILCFHNLLACFLSVSVRSVLAFTSPFGLTWTSSGASNVESLTVVGTISSTKIAGRLFTTVTSGAG